MSIGFVMAANSLQDGRRALQRARQLDALVQAGAERGFTVTVLPDSRPDLLSGAQIDALYFPDPADDRTILRDAVAAGIPVAANDLTVPGGVLTIRTGYAAAVRAGLAHLTEAGAQRIGFLVDESEVPRDQLGESAYLAWSAVNGRTPLVARVDAGRRRLVPALHELLDTDVDAVFAYCEEGPEIYLHLEQIDTVMPRDLQLLVLCTIDCEMNARLGITHLCLHPEKAPEVMFAALDAARRRARSSCRSSWSAARPPAEPRVRLGSRRSAVRNSSTIADTARATPDFPGIRLRPTVIQEESGTSEAALTMSGCPRSEPVAPSVRSSRRAGSDMTSGGSWRRRGRATSAMASHCRHPRCSSRH